MLLLVSLPYEKDLELDEEVDNINKEHKLGARRIEIPKFSGVSLENIIKYEEMVEKMNSTVTDICKKFIRRTGPYDEDTLFSTIGWSKHSNNTCLSIETCLKLISEDIERIRSTYYQKELEHSRSLKDYEEAQKRTKGSLLDMDLSVILGERTEYEFLKEVFVLIDVEEIKKFKNTIENTACLSEETIEVVASDDKHVLYKAVVVRNMEAELKRILKENFILKESVTKTGEKTPQEKIKHYEENKDNLQIFIDTHKDEAMGLLVHTSLMKVFIESIYRYGLPIKYLYFICKETPKVINKLREVGDNWESERMVGDDEYSGQDDQEVNIAKVFIVINE